MAKFKHFLLFLITFIMIGWNSIAMAEAPRDPASNFTSDILRAKYAEDEGVRRSAVAAIINALREGGRYSALIDLCHDAAAPRLLRDESEAAILQAAFVSVKKYGTDDALFDVATRQDVPLEVAMHAGLALALRNSVPYREEALWGIVIDPRFHDEARVAAGKNMEEQSASDLKFSVLFRMATVPEVPYEVRKPSALRLISLAQENGNYPILLRLQDQRFLPVDVRIALEDKVEEAATKAIESAYALQDFAILTDISEDRRLPDAIRRKASGCLHDSISDRPPRPDGPVETGKAAELMHRLGKKAGAVRTGTAPPSTRADPPSRLKR